MQKLGQHFLTNAAILQTIAAALKIEKNETVIEIGPGHGELTALLVDASEKLGGAVVSIEKDHSLIAPLEALSGKATDGLLTIIEGDALKLLPDAVAGCQQYKIVGNIPYYITGKLLRIISELGEKPQRTVLLIQKEVAERICAAPPAMNRLAASVQFWADPKIITFVPRKDFSPAPDVDSAVIVLDKKNPENVAQSVDPELYYRAVRSIFAQPRKTLSNNLREAVGGAAGKEEIGAYLEKIGIDPEARPQDLDIADIIRITKTQTWG